MNINKKDKESIQETIGLIIKSQDKKEFDKALKNGYLTIAEIIKKNNSKSTEHILIYFQDQLIHHKKNLLDWIFQNIIKKQSFCHSFQYNLCQMF